MTAEQTPADLRSRAAALSIDSVDPAGPLAVEAMRRYFTDLDRIFDSDFAAGPFEHHGPFLVVSVDGEPIAAGGLRWIDAGTAEVKRMWVDASWRGAGLGKRMLAAIEQLARSGGAERIVLDTKRALTDAIGMYERAGYRPIERYNDNRHAELFFTKDLTGPIVPA